MATDNLNQLLAVLAHELRNPLAAIRNALRVLEELGGGEHTLRQRRVIERQVQHLARRVDELMEALQLALSKAAPESEALDLDEFTAQFLAALALASSAGHAEKRTDAPAEAAAGGGTEGGCGLSILVVEDNLDGRESLRDLLEVWGHDVDLAEDGRQGLERALAAPHDVALIDIGLPGLDGNEVARGIRAAPSTDDISLIAMTGYGRPEDRRRAFQAGFDTYLVKPVDPADLARLLGDVRPHRLTS